MEDCVLSASDRRIVQVRRRRRDFFRESKRGVFLTVLAATCNVRLAAAAAKVGTPTVYRARQRDPEFAALWREAMILGYERLETALLARALGTDAPPAADFDFGDPDAILPEGEIDSDLALRLLAHNRAAGQGRSRTTRGHVATEAETNAALIRKLMVLQRQLAQRDAQTKAGLLEDKR